MTAQSDRALAGDEDQSRACRIAQGAMIEKAANLVEVAAPTEAAVDLALAACDGEPRAAIRALIVLVAHLEEELSRARKDISRGYARGRYGAPR
jgi:hypothetical protein